jgi:hypothetical protein
MRPAIQNETTPTLASYDTTPTFSCKMEVHAILNELDKSKRHSSDRL